MDFAGRLKPTIASACRCPDGGVVPRGLGRPPWTASLDGLLGHRSRAVTAAQPSGVEAGGRVTFGALYQPPQPLTYGRGAVTASAAQQSRGQARLILLVALDCFAALAMTVFVAAMGQWFRRLE